MVPTTVLATIASVALISAQLLENASTTVHSLKALQSSQRQFEVEDDPDENNDSQSSKFPHLHKEKINSMQSH